MVRTRKTPASRAQRTASFAFALFIFLQAPLFTYPVKEGSRVVKNEASGPLEVVAMWMLSNRPAVGTTAKWMLVPGMWYKEISRASYFCLNGKEKEVPCKARLAAVFDLDNLLALSDYSSKVDPFEESVDPKGLQVLQVCAETGTVTPRGLPPLACMHACTRRARRTSPLH